MGNSANLIRRIITCIVPARDHISVDGSVIPTPDRRWCGPEFKNNAFYLRSAEKEAIRLKEHLQCTRESRVLDIGCGQGRLAIGLLRTIGELDYLGIDINQRAIKWCKRHLRSSIHGSNSSI